MEKQHKNSIRATSPTKKCKKKLQLTGAQKFQLTKYQHFILETLGVLANRQLIGSEHFEMQDSAEQERIRKVAKWEMVIDEPTLFKEFIGHTKHYIPTPEIRLFQITLDKMQDREFHHPVCVYIETLALKEKRLMRAIF